jgi:hypothetical protein
MEHRERSKIVKSVTASGKIRTLPVGVTDLIILYLSRFDVGQREVIFVFTLVTNKRESTPYFLK